MGVGVGMGCLEGTYPYAYATRPLPPCRVTLVIAVVVASIKLVWW